MATQFSIPASPTRSIMTIDKFLGVDFTNDPSNVSIYQSPNAVNMIRDSVGKVRKRKGYEIMYSFTKTDGEEYIPHEIIEYIPYKDNEFLIQFDRELRVCRNGIFLDEPKYILQLPNIKIPIQGYVLKDKLYINTYNNYFVYSSENGFVSMLNNKEETYIPTIVIARLPSGGGASYEAINLLTDYHIEQFIGDGTSVDYYYTFSDSSVKTVEVLNSDGEWETLERGVDYDAYVGGYIKFKNPPGKPPVTGEDNVRFTVMREHSLNYQKITYCTISYVYNESNLGERFFFGGNPNYPGYDWYSAQGDPTYFPDINYSIVGSQESNITGYTVINNKLATFKDDKEKDNSVYLREFFNQDGEQILRIVDTIHCDETALPNTINILNSEPMFATKNGVYALTVPDSGNQYAQLRSYYLNGKLINEDLKNCRALKYKDFYILYIKNGNVYVLDSLQSLYEQNVPYSTRQYVGYFLTDIKPTCMWEKDGELWFGNKYGEILRFLQDDDIYSYRDERQCNGSVLVGAPKYIPIYCCWETPDIMGSLFYKNKTFRYLSVKLRSALQTSLKIYSRKNGLWRFLKEDNVRGKFFSYSHLIYSKFTYSTNTMDRLFNTKLRLKKLDSVNFRFENDKIDEPFVIENIGLEYVQTGNHK